MSKPGLLQKINISSRTQAHSVSPLCHPQCVAFCPLGLLLSGDKITPNTTVTHDGISHRKRKGAEKNILAPQETFFMSHNPEVHMPNPRPITGNKKWNV